MTEDIFRFKEAAGSIGYRTANDEIVQEPLFRSGSRRSIEGYVHASTLDRHGHPVVHIVRADGVETGRIVNATTYRDFSEGLLPFQSDGLWGYCNHLGEIVIAPSFTIARDFSRGVAEVFIRSNLAEKETSGLIDRKGNWVVAPSFVEISSFGAMFAIVKLEQLDWAVLDIASGTLSKKRWEFLFRPTQHGILFSQNGKVGMLGIEGDMRVSAKYDMLNISDEDELLVAPSNVDGQSLYGIMNTDEEWVVGPSYTYLDAKRGGKRMAYKGGWYQNERVEGLMGGKFGFIDNKGDTEVEFVFDDVLPFDRGAAFVGIFDNHCVAWDGKVCEKSTSDHEASSGVLTSRGQLVWESRTVDETMESLHERARLQLGAQNR